MRPLLFISILFSCRLVAQNPFIYPIAKASNQIDTTWGKVIKDPLQVDGEYYFYRNNRVVEI